MGYYTDWRMNMEIVVITLIVSLWILIAAVPNWVWSALFQIAVIVGAAAIAWVCIIILLVSLSA